MPTGKTKEQAGVQDSVQVLAVSRTMVRHAGVVCYGS